MAKLPKYLERALELLETADNAQDYLDILNILNTGVALKAPLARGDIVARIESVVVEIKTIEQILITHTMGGHRIDEHSGGFGAEANDLDLNIQIWPSKPDDLDGL